MIRQIRRLLFTFVLSLTLCIIACKDTVSATRNYFVFGTTVQITLENIPTYRVTELFQTLQSQMTEMHQQWHAWENSKLTEINALCLHGGEVKLDKDLEKLLALGKLYERQSLGHFNPAMGALIELWGFYSSTPNENRRPPSATQINHLLSQKPSMENLSLLSETVTCTNPAVKLDFGGYAKGFAIQKIHDFLKSQGISHALINAGGDIMTLGPKANKKPWRIAVENPHTPEQTMIIKAQDEAIFTSGISARGFYDKGQYFHHLLNPLTGYPADTFLSVTVIHPDPTLADAAASALMLMGESQWQSLANRFGVDKVMILKKNGEKILSPAFSARIVE